MPLAHELPQPTVKRRRIALWISVVFLSLCLLSIGVFIGVWTGARQYSGVSFSQFVGSLPEELADQDTRSDALNKVWSSIQQRYLRAPQKSSALYYGALKGIVDSLEDPYSVFLDPEMTEAFTTELEGTFDGIGAEIGFKDKQLTVIAPLPDSPAARVGIKAGDAIIAIDGTDTENLALPEAIAMIRGPKGTTVTLHIIRASLEEPFTVTITRDNITLESVRWEMLDNQVAYLQITHFDSRVTASFDNAVREAVIENPRGVILDLRDNPGGYLDAAVQIAGRFLAESGTVIVSERFNTGEEKKYQSDAQGTLSNIPMVVVVNTGSASASEIVAGALQDYGRATIIGETTFGKGTVQDYEQFDDGSSLKLTVAEWFTPKGRSISERGIEPDILVVQREGVDIRVTDDQLDRAEQSIQEKY